MLPKVIIYNAVSLDSRVNGFPADIAKYYELAAHWNEDATLVGSETMLKSGNEVPPETEDDLKPPKKKAGDTRALLVVVDGRGRIRGWHYWRKLPYWRDVVALCSRKTPQEYLTYLEKQHIDYIITGDEHVDLKAALEELNKRYKVKTVRVDSGGTLNGALLRAGLVDEISLLIHPSLAGSKQQTFFQAEELSSEEAIKLRLTHMEKLKGDMIWLRYDVETKRSQIKI
jgi:2,5-diamino-6-(ribosylamino)-4(3H)-pyrimidinone 5'-phosphate reductase